MTEKMNVSDALNLAVAFHTKGDLNSASEIYKKILEVDSKNSDAWHLFGLVDYELKNYSSAAQKIENAIRLKPNSALFYGNLGMVYNMLNDEEKSARNFIRALDINPNYKNAKLAYYNLGVYYREKGDLVKAIDNYDRAIEIDENFFDARWNRVLILLLLGEFEKGWKDYECRFRKKEPVDSRAFSKPKWDGSNLDGKKILVLSEQGFGDNIQFVRYLSLVEKRGGHIIFECSSELRKLFEQLSCVSEFVNKQDVFDIDFDFYIHLLDLPKIFNTNLDNIPSEIPYLRTDKNLSDELKKKFETNNFKVGIVWAGNPNQANDKNRSTVFENFKFLKKISGVNLYSLQKGGATLSDSDVFDLGEFIHDFSDTASIIDNLDLIISVDTSAAHLAGAMGVPVWILLPFIPDWRWLLDRKDSLWYPSMKLFRQKKPGDWDSVFREVDFEIRKLLDTHRA